jgi:hypothetical protein
VTSDPTPLGVSVGITNTRLNAAKRGIAVELALRLVAAANTPVCLVGADPTDRDVERRMPELLDGYEHTLRQISDGTRSLEATFVPARRLCIVSIPDRAGVEAVLPELRSTFRCVVIDAPSRVGSGVGIARVLLEHLNVLFVASGLKAGELIDARNYVDQFAAIPRARHVAVGVLTSGHPDDSGMSRTQLERRLGVLPVIERIPRLWGRTNDRSPTDEDLDDAFRPVVDWIVGRVRENVAPPPAVRQPSVNNHVAASRYRDV